MRQPLIISPSLDKELNLLGWRLADGALTVLGYQCALADIVQRLFNCSTVALWRVSGVPGERSLQCLGRYQSAAAGLPCRDVVSESQLRQYFEVLSDRGVYACEDTLNDENLKALESWYRRPDAPRAFLDTLVAINGQALCVLSCYHESGRRQWAIDEETALKRLGARVALHLARMNPPGFGLE